MYGTFYTQHGLLKITGNGGSDVLGSQYISWDLALGGNLSSPQKRLLPCKVSK
jgi:hypothetical protein